MQNRKTSRSKHLDFILLDLLVIEASFWLAYYLRMGRLRLQEEYKFIQITILLSHVALVFLMEAYSGILRRSMFRELGKVIVHNGELFAILLFILFFEKETSFYSRIFVGLFAVIDTALMFLVRSVRKRMIQRGRRHGKNRERMLVLSDEKHAEHIVTDLKNSMYSERLIEGVVVTDADLTGQEIAGVPVVANRESMYEYVKTNVIDEVFIRFSNDDIRDMTERFLSMGVMVHVSINNILSGTPNAGIDRIGEYAVITTSTNVMSLKQTLVKRTMDIIGSLIGIVFMLLFTVIFGPIIYIQSPGPIFFKQTRVGKNGRTFKIYKFRSMYMDAEERKKELMEKNKMSGLMFKMDNDPRIIPIGRFMRKTSIDEFPQFINILKGDMSLVGTRPPTVEEFKQYDEHHKSRLAMKPGLTGMWQVSGRSDITDFEEVVRLDNEYINNFSIALDIKILCKTVLSVLKREGSE